MKPTKLVSALAAIGFGVGLTLSAGPASAVVEIFSPITAFQDDDLDFVVDNQPVGTVGNGIISVGDRIISVIKFGNTQGIIGGQGPTPISGEEITGVADITVAAVLGDGTLVFAPSGAAGLLSAFAAGTMVALWRDPANDLDVINSNCGTRANCILNAGLGEGVPLYLTAGNFGDTDFFWTSLPGAGGENIATVQNGGSSTAYGAFSFGLQPGINNTGLNLGLQSCLPFCAGGLDDNMIQITGSGNILGGQGLLPAQWTARSDNDFQIRPIPEPGSLALLGLALAAAGWGPLRRKLKM